MNSPKLYVTDHDLQQLRQVIADAQWQRQHTPADLEQLEAELSRRVPVAPDAVPGDVVTLNSDVQLLDLDAGEVFGCSLVLPEEADPTLFKISVLAPVGLAVLGHRVGDRFEWPVPSGTQRLKVLALLYQPEAAGQYDR
jgi:regulator of nucleoside diphosphate kinase